MGGCRQVRLVVSNLARGATEERKIITENSSLGVNGTVPR